MLRSRVDDGGSNHHDRVIEVVMSFDSANGKAQGTFAYIAGSAIGSRSAFCPPRQLRATTQKRYTVSLPRLDMGSEDPDCQYMAQAGGPVLNGVHLSS